jgi:hypothetical protein
VVGVRARFRVHLADRRPLRHLRLAFAAGEPAFWWGFLVVLGGQFLVALVFAELVLRWPIEGSVY